MANPDIKLLVSVLTLTFRVVFPESVYMSDFSYQISGFYYFFTQVWKTDAQTLLCMQWRLGILVQMQVLGELPVSHVVLYHYLGSFKNKACQYIFKSLERSYCGFFRMLFHMLAYQYA